MYEIHCVAHYTYRELVGVVKEGWGVGQHIAHKNTKMQFLENKCAVQFYKSFQNEKRFLQTVNDSIAS